MNYALNSTGIGGKADEATRFCYSNASDNSGDYWMKTVGGGTYPLWFYLNAGPNNILQAITCGTQITEVAKNVTTSTSYKSLVQAISGAAASQTITLDSLPVSVVAYYDGGVITTNGLTINGASPAPLLVAFLNTSFQGILTVNASNITVNNINFDQSHGGGGVTAIKVDDTNTGFIGTNLVLSNADTPFQTGGNTGYTQLNNVTIHDGGCCGVGQDHNLYMSTTVCGNVQRTILTTTATWAANSNTLTVADATQWHVGDVINGTTNGSIPSANLNFANWVQTVSGNTVTIGPFNTTATSPSPSTNDIGLINCVGKTAPDIDSYDIENLKSVNVSGGGWLFKQRNVGGRDSHNTHCATNSVANCVHDSLIVCTEPNQTSGKCFNNGAMDFSCGGDHIVSNSVIGKNTDNDSAGFYMIKVAEEATFYPFGCQLYTDVPIQSVTFDHDIIIDDMDTTAGASFQVVVCLWHVGLHHCNDAAVGTVACSITNSVIVYDPKANVPLEPGNGCNGTTSGGVFCTLVAGKCTDSSGNRVYQDRLTAATNEGWLNTSFTDPSTGTVYQCTTLNLCVYPYFPAHM